MAISCIKGLDKPLYCMYNAKHFIYGLTIYGIYGISRIYGYKV